MDKELDDQPPSFRDVVCTIIAVCVIVILYIWYSQLCWTLVEWIYDAQEISYLSAGISFGTFFVYLVVIQFLIPAGTLFGLVEFFDEEEKEECQEVS